MHVALEITLRLRAGINKVTEETEITRNWAQGPCLPYQTFCPVTERPTGTWGDKTPLKTLFPLGVHVLAFFLSRFPGKPVRCKNPWRLLHPVKGRKKPLSKP